MKNRYVIISPVRDEEAHLRETISSVLAQTVRPVEWVLVNDGSRDKTPELIDEASRCNSWIHAVHMADRGFRQPGGGVVATFNRGYHALRRTDWEFLVKLDGDLSFEDSYFEKCLGRFASNPKLGVGGGTIFSSQRGELRAEAGPSFHVRGATKIYSRQCWEAIGGFVQAPGWDTIDEMKARMLGWHTETFPEIHLFQHRPTGMAAGWFRDLLKNGRANYITGYHPLFMLAKCCRRAVRRPYVLGSLALGLGFVSGYLGKTPRVDDEALISYVRRQQMARLRGRPSIWD